MKYFSTNSVARFISSASSISIAAMAKATSNSPCSLAYTYSATVSVAPALDSPSNRPLSACAKPAVKSSAALHGGLAGGHPDMFSQEVQAAYARA